MKHKSQGSYRHRPLKHDKSIRLVKLLPFQDERRIRCRLITVNIDEFPPYEAISYVWGDPKDKSKVICHGKTLKIPTNLFYALQQFREETKPRILWADSICINQRDLVERQKQVQIMGKIYEKARRVLVWFGRDLGSDAGPAFDFAKTLASISRSLRYPLMENQESYILSHIEQVPTSQRDSIINLLSNEWFSRVWVLQEVGLARECLVTWGDKTLDWNELCAISKALAWLDVGSFRLQKLVYYCAYDLGYLDFQSKLPILEVLDYARSFQCSDPRDKIYALLAHSSFRDALSTSTSLNPIPVDYSLPYSETYFATAKTLLEGTNCGPLSVLSYVGHTHETINNPELPSWVPQWNVIYDATVLMLEHQIYSASGHIAPHYFLSNHTLEIRGLLFDSIKWTSDVFKPEDFKRGLVSSKSIFENIFDELECLEQGPLTEEAFEKFCLTLNAGNCFKSRKGPQSELPRQQRIADCVAFFEATGVKLAILNKLKDKFGSGNLFRFWETAYMCCNRRFFVTEKGYYGIGPEVSREGDKVSILFGAKVPFVLRPQMTGYYRLSGECYIHGIMDGEAVEMWKTGELEEQKLVLI
ncbi:uncharacterized protein K452DRAFT_288228 [Aplosporella prunicola CBS 121167]|uniref:Heterokaryon incompatibility domain-containing protein n=1 Tax=Aplosporella prunicola CBS 121167 TaxID=1176127 RepID=A0A6A6BC33_9PEZI|nr:uncharacterized protein K452DRAFT_288228 [Aplosporella prunicola CBS 121167]KAF2140805.1 hypothetical protein K452DRAFT_288228 [Aplosporella prunicola CBS 121167]